MLIKAPVTSWWKSQARRWAGGCGAERRVLGWRSRFGSHLCTHDSGRQVSDINGSPRSLVWPM